MNITLQITSRKFELTEPIEEAIRKQARKLDQFYDRINRCKVTVEVPHRHRHKGILYNVRINMTVPGGEIVVEREPHEDVYVSIRDAFDAARRQMQTWTGVRRGEVKFHEEAPHGRVCAIFPGKGYGFLTTWDGREIYFHRNSVLGDKFDRLMVGTEVRFVEEEGAKGPQASTLTVIGD